MIVLTAAEARRIDALTIERCGTPGHVLMERAGTGATRVLLEQFPHVRRERVLVCAGRGNNGGDGAVIARLLRQRRVRSEIALLGGAGEVGSDAARALAAARRARVPVTEVTTAAQIAALARACADAALVVDGLFGTGLNAPVRGRIADIIHAVNAGGAPVFAVDIPSGINADTGQPLGVAVQAEATATFGFAKIGHVVYPGLQHTGTLAVVDIGLAPAAVEAVAPQTHLLQESDAAALVPVRAPEAHKGSCGHVLVIAGSRGRSGAARLAAHAACRGGAGLTTLAGPASLNDVLASGIPESMTALLRDDDGRVRFDELGVRSLLDGKTAVVVGPGLGTHDDAQRLVEFLVREIALPLVIDADALTCVARNAGMLQSARARAVLTPHPGEMARLIAGTTADVQADRVAVARHFAATHRCALVLKGARSIIAAADGRAWINPTGNPNMASGGMGDALSGLLGALLAQGLSVEDAARLSVYTHGAVADALAQTRGHVGILASDIIEGLPAMLARLSAARPEMSAASASSRRKRR